MLSTLLTLEVEERERQRPQPASMRRRGKEKMRISLHEEQKKERIFVCKTRERPLFSLSQFAISPHAKKRLNEK